jgi:hypothetical protein
MNRRRLARWSAVLSGAALTSAIPGVARTDDVSMFPVDFTIRTACYGKFTRTRITGEIHNNSGHAADHLRLVVDGLDGEGPRDRACLPFRGRHDSGGWTGLLRNGGPERSIVPGACRPRRSTPGALVARANGP